MDAPAYSLRPTESDDPVAQLALDLRWSWNHTADRIWQTLDPELWDLTRNPWVVLQSAPKKKLQAVFADPSFQALLDEVKKAQREAIHAPRWFEKAHPNSRLTAVAYFSMEYMLSEALPIYSGGLGNVAGDQLKAAHDLGVPVIGIGLLYQRGYFRQEIDSSGHQHALYPFNDPGQLPIKPLRDANGDMLRLSIGLPGFSVWVRTWEVQVGRTKLYLLDTNDPANLPEYRGITSELYGGGAELRLRQEQVLGIGGWRLLRALGIQPELCHLNEGHAAFAVLERAASYMEDTGHPFDVALAVTRAGNLFTTHTPVAAGFDRFPQALMEPYFSHYAPEKLKISFHDLMALGRQNPGDDDEPFNMAYLAIRGSGAINGVSRLHGEVSRRIFQPLFPGWPEAEVPVGYVTNGIHVPTWDSSDALWDAACGQDRWRGEQENIPAQIRGIGEVPLWRMRNDGRKSLVEYARQRYARQVASHGAMPDQIAAARQIFDPATLTLGFARRFAEYKRPNLLLRDPERLIRILTNPSHPVQLILAGKAHPQDQPGQEMIHQWNEFIRRPEVRGHVIFLSDYDMLLTESMVGGVDVWINTPRRPWEASGTSGMKVLANGGLNLSELDGWWAEAYAPEVGWAIGDGQEHNGDPEWDARDAESLYALLESEIVPEFYDRNHDGIPEKWVARMRESMARLTPAFSANRSVREYTESHYLPAAAEYVRRAGRQGKFALDLMDWKSRLAKFWQHVRFGTMQVTREGDQWIFDVPVYTDDLGPDALRVELFADGQDGAPPFCQVMDRSAEAEGSQEYRYTTRVAALRDSSDFTPRAIPHLEGAVVPLEASQILWER